MLARYARWLHTGWPAGTVERLPEVLDEAGRTAVPGLFVVGDLTGVPLLKLALDSGTRAARAVADELGGGRAGDPEVWDLAIVGAGPAGLAAAVEAKRLGLRACVLEASRPFSTIANFPRRKPIFVYPSGMTPAGQVQVTADVKEALLAELEAQRAAHGIEPLPVRVERIARQGGALELRHADGQLTRARRVIVAVGRSGDFRRLGVPGEELDKVTNRLHDPRAHTGQDVLVVGGGDSAAEAAVALALAGARVTLSYRQAALSRPKPENLAKLEQLARDPSAEVAVERPSSERITTAFSRQMLAGDASPGALRLALGTRVAAIEPQAVVLRHDDGREERLANQAVFSMIGREAPLELFRRAGVPIRGEWRWTSIAAFALFFLLCCFLYSWKSGGDLTRAFQRQGWFPFRVPAWVGAEGWLAVTLREPGFWYSAAYCALVSAFGLRRIRRRRTPYVTLQTAVLILFQVIPLFALPYFLLPAAGAAGWFDQGWGQTVADALFPRVGYGYGREYWRAFGLVLAWPLFVWNAFTAQPLTAWLVISLLQTFVLVPLLVWRWGKGAYCGWICSCGALAETLGDAQRTKMPHGPLWNRLNMVGQVILGLAFLLLGLRIVGWLPLGAASRWAAWAYGRGLQDLSLGGVPLDYKHVVDLFLAGIVGVGCYFWLSGRVWCRFACPLAALMHVYARLFTRFRIFADKQKCISCNVCTAVCHQGIDVMSFANKGLPMADPQCVRCSACVSSCPTGTLSFGRLGRDGAPVLDGLAASPVQMRERGRALPVVA